MPTGHQSHTHNIIEISQNCCGCILGDKKRLVQQFVSGIKCHRQQAKITLKKKKFTILREVSNDSRKYCTNSGAEMVPDKKALKEWQ